MSAQFTKTVRKVVTVTTAGTPVQISATSIWVRSCIIQSKASNTGLIYMGPTSADALAASGHALINPGDLVSLQGDIHHARNIQLDLSGIWINSSVDGEKAIVTYLIEVL